MKAALLAAFLWQGAAPAPADPFCKDVRLLAGAALEADPFERLRGRNFRPRLLDACVARAADYQCKRLRPRAGETRESVAHRIRACLPAWPPASLLRDIDLRGNETMVVQASAFQALVTTEHNGRSRRRGRRRGRRLRKIFCS
ncbi:MAG TPA: hypothetical protein VIP46_10885 [Pyrinomonadaceae bacterium]